jgi:hypothetical protein
MEELYWLWRQPKRDTDSPYRPTAFSLEPAPGEAEQANPQPKAGQAAYQIPRADVTVTYELGGRRYHWRGRLDRFEGIGVDERTRTVPCRVVVPSPREVTIEDANGALSNDVGPRALVRGMFVRLRIHAEPDAELVRIPEQAIRPGGKVFVVRDIKPAGDTDANGDEEMPSDRPWNEGTMYEEKVLVAAVMNGNAIIDAGAFRLRVGERVAVTPVALEKGNELRMIPPEGIVVREAPQR